MDTIDYNSIQGSAKKKILILGGGFAGSKVLTELQKDRMSDRKITTALKHTKLQHDPSVITNTLYHFPIWKFP